MNLQYRIGYWYRQISVGIYRLSEYRQKIISMHHYGNEDSQWRGGGGGMKMERESMKEGEEGEEGGREWTGSKDREGEGKWARVDGRVGGE